MQELSIRRAAGAAAFGATFALFATCCAPTTAHAQLTFYNNRATYNAAFPGQQVEDFEEGRGNSVAFAPPLNSASNNAVFQPGEILSGLNIFTTGDAGNVGDRLAFFTAGGGVASKQVVSNYNTNTLELQFTAGTAAAGVDLINFSNGTFNISVFDVNDALLGNTSVIVQSGGQFFGVSSAGNAIGRISLNSPGFESVDNVTFGAAQAGSTAAPEPATLALVATGLLPLVGAVIRRRKR